uniref:Protein RCC2 n=1 Tax=Macaca mulatta TaxID=9544 RepID=A0A1D5QIA8_MACMU
GTSLVGCCVSEVTIFQRASSGDLSRRAQEKQSSILLSRKEVPDAQTALRGRPEARSRARERRRSGGAEAGGVARGAGRRLGWAGTGGAGAPAPGPPAGRGRARPRAPRLPPRRALACRAAAHVFLFCVVAFVLEARIYILSVSGEWAGALVWAGKKKSPPIHLLVASLPFFSPVSHHSNQKLEGSKCKGQLLIFGATNWDLIGRKEVPKQQAAYRNLGQNLWGPHRYGCLAGVRVRTVVSGSCAAHSLLITTEGKLWSWGRNEKGQLGHGDTKRVEAPRLIEGLSHEVIVSAACGRNHTLALTETGSVFAFGENKMGQLGLGNQTDAVPSPAQIMYNGQPITKMACGAEFSMIMDCKGNLYSFGCPEYGQLGHNSDGKFIARAQRIEYDCELVPRRVAIFIEKTKDGQILPVPNVVVRDVACGANHTLVLDSQKRVFSWGFGGYGRLGHAEQKDEMVPRLVKLFDFPGRGASQIYAGYTCSFAVSEVGGLFFWGATNTSRESTMYPKAVQDLCGWRIRSLACGKSSIIVAADESTISWGPSPTFGELGYGDHKPKSSTAAQEVKTLDGIFSEQVSGGGCASSGTCPYPVVRHSSRF